MKFDSGKKLGKYEIVGPLGIGGMGEVYRARDTKLKREVAIKVLPDAFARDAERVARFQREAEVLASLNHRHIAAIYELAEFDESRFLVLELVEGETLAERLKRGSIPADDALAIARQIAEALEAAHEKAITHRDLKPANIKVTPDGEVKVLDFGLAKAMEPSPSAQGEGFSNSPTLSMAATNAGVILGTAAYMSPEQAKGLSVDSRSDVFSFGCVLYEMLTGRQTFQGETISEILASVLVRDPDFTRLPPDLNPRLVELLRRCLEKNPKRRWQAAGDLKMELETVASDAHRKPEIAESVPAQGRRRERLAWIAAALVLAVAVGVPYFRAPAETPEMRTDIVTPSTSDPISFAISPDGRRLVFVASGDGQPRLWLRPLDAVTAQPLAGTEGASYPFWSPDSRSVGFFAAGKLKRVDVVGGLPQTLANATAGRGGTWSSDGVILFAPSTNGPLSRISASGGEAVALTKVDPPRQLSHKFPQFLPGGRQFLFYATGSADAQGIYMGSLDAPEAKRLTAADTAGLYAPSGWLLFVRQGTLVARRFDLTRGELSGDPVTVADPVGFDASSAGAFSVSASGLVSYRGYRGVGRRELTWFDRSGKALGTVGAPDENGLQDPELSPDGRRVAVSRAVQGNRDIWLLDGVRSTRLTFDAGIDAYPLWSRDESRIVFSSFRKGPLDLYEKPSSSAGNEQSLVESPQAKAADDFSRDGRFLLYVSVDPKTRVDLWVRPMDGEKKPFVFLNTSFDERLGQFSPDGHWVAYQSDESGRAEIYVRPFPPQPTGQWRLVSTSGGIAPRWQPDGKELYYISPDGKLMAAPITLKGTSLEPGAPEALFQTRIVGGGANSGILRQQYDVAPDGRFLINVTVEDAVTSPITLLQNWKPPAK